MLMAPVVFRSALLVALSDFFSFLAAKINSVIPNLTMGVMAIVCGIAALQWIPETKLLTMPDNIAEVTVNKR